MLLQEVLPHKTVFADGIFFLGQYQIGNIVITPQGIADASAFVHDLLFHIAKSPFFFIVSKDDQQGKCTIFMNGKTPLLYGIMMHV